MCRTTSQVAGTSVLQCPRDGCHEVVAVAHRNGTAPAGEGKALGTDRHGAPIYRCVCGERIVWERKLLRDAVR